VSMPGVDRATAQGLIDKAHSQICPYSNAVRGNVEVNVTLV
jgi:lipoyl-dependent peroxiredoxin